MVQRAFGWLMVVLFWELQTITGAMSTLTPPISLEKPENQARVDYIQDYASSECNNLLKVHRS
jgi:hypothetical protein